MSVSNQNSMNSFDDVDLPDTDVDKDGLLTDDELGLTADFLFGIVENDIYTNDFATLSFHKPSNEWKFMTKDEIFNHYYDSGADVILDDTTNETYYVSKEGNVYYDMFLYNMETNQNIQLMITECANDTVISLNDYFLSFEEELNNSFDNTTFESAGIVTLGDNVYSVKKANLTVGEENIIQYYAGTKIDNNFVLICITNNALNDEGFNGVFQSITE